MRNWSGAQGWLRASVGKPTSLIRLGTKRVWSTHFFAMLGGASVTTSARDNDAPFYFRV